MCVSVGREVSNVIVRLRLWVVRCLVCFAGGGSYLFAEYLFGFFEETLERNGALKSSLVNVDK